MIYMLERHNPLRTDHGRYSLGPFCLALWNERTGCVQVARNWVLAGARKRILAGEAWSAQPSPVGIAAAAAMQLYSWFDASAAAPTTSYDRYF